MNELTIIMYHYVRPISQSEYPGIKGLELESFYKQLDYLEENYSIVSSEEVIKAITNKKKLAPKSCWLTFDDGYKDHFNYVMPELLKRKISGAFFPPKFPIANSQMLDVNSIHYILSNCKSIDKLVTDLNDMCHEHGLPKSKIDNYFKEHGIAGRFDNAPTIYVKRMLQHVLPEDLRRTITARLFKSYVGESENLFAKKLYMEKNEVAELVKNGMYVGSHGCRHYWLNQISEEEQRLDISKSLEFLEEVNASTNNWIMCYPYGAYNKSTLSIVKDLGASVGVTTKTSIADIIKDNPLTLPRLDTNDFPQ